MPLQLENEELAAGEGVFLIHNSLSI